MNVKSLYDVFGLKFQDNYIDVVLTDEPRLSFCDAKDILKASGINFHTKESELGIYIKDRHGVTINTIFIDGSNPERFRGMTIRNLYVDKNIKDLNKAKWIYTCAKRIIEKD